MCKSQTCVTNTFKSVGCKALLLSFNSKLPINIQLFHHFTKKSYFSPEIIKSLFNIFKNDRIGTVLLFAAYDGV